MLTLFLCITVGFIAKKTKLLPDSAGTVMAKLETWVFCPALSFTTMARFCTVATLKAHATNLLLASFCVVLAIFLGIFFARFFVKDRSAERGIYRYSLTFANAGYMGDPVVMAVLGDLAFSYYKLFCIPLSIATYTWGMICLVPSTEKKNLFKKLFNAPMIATFLGIIFGLTGLSAYIPTFANNALDSLKGCMGPVAMLLAGFTVAKYDLIKMLKKTKVYAATAFRLVILPIIIVGAMFGFRELLNTLFGLNIGNAPLFLEFFAVSMPLGLNTVVFPEAYGGNPETGASMALISHTLCVISIPVMYAIMVAVFGQMVI